MGHKNRDEYCNGNWKQYRHTPAGKIMAGILLVLVGATLLARQLGVEFPHWLFTWPVVVILIGLYSGARHLFCNPSWVVLVGVGSIFLYDQMNPDINISTFIWPVVIIMIGLMMIIKSKRRRCHQLQDDPKFEEMSAETGTEDGDTIDTVAVFGGVKKNILSKNFKGGEITCVMGGAEINLMQADIEGRVTLEVTQVLGGTKLLIPAHWEVHPDMMAVLGGIEDKRPMHTGAATGKVLVLKGTSVLGGIEIKSY